MLTHQAEFVWLYSAIRTAKNAVHVPSAEISRASRRFRYERCSGTRTIANCAVRCPSIRDEPTTSITRRLLSETDGHVP